MLRRNGLPKSNRPRSRRRPRPRFLRAVFEDEGRERGRGRRRCVVWRGYAATKEVHSQISPITQLRKAEGQRQEPHAEREDYFDVAAIVDLSLRERPCSLTYQLAEKGVGEKFDGAMQARWCGGTRPAASVRGPLCLVVSPGETPGALAGGTPAAMRRRKGGAGRLFGDRPRSRHGRMGRQKNRPRSRRRPRPRFLRAVLFRGRRTRTRTKV